MPVGHHVRPVELQQALGAEGVIRAAAAAQTAVETEHLIAAAPHHLQIVDTCNTVQPSWRRSSSSSWWNCSVDGTSSPAWASSSTSKRRGRTTQNASSTRLSWPPESSLSRRSPRPPQPVRCRACWIAWVRPLPPPPSQARFSPGRSKPNPTNSLTVRGKRPCKARVWAGRRSGSEPSGEALRQDRVPGPGSAPNRRTWATAPAGPPPGCSCRRHWGPPGRCRSPGPGRS